MKIKVKGKRQTIGVTQRQKKDNTLIRHLMFDIINDVIFDVVFDIDDVIYDVIFDAINNVAFDIDVIMDKN